MNYPPPSIVRAALAVANVKAFIHCIAAGESFADLRPEAYTLISGGGHITSFAAHPWYGVSTNDGAKATGAYQFLGTTWAEVAAAYPDDIKTFTPAEQDFAAVARLTWRGALPAVIRGNLATVCSLLHDEWRSLPGGSEQNHDLAAVAATFARYGGMAGEVHTDIAKPAEVSPESDLTPIPAIQPEVAVQNQPEGPTMGALALPFLQTILPTVIGLFSQKAQTQIVKATGASPDAAAAFLQNLIQQVGTVAQVPVIDQTSAIQAVATVTKPDATAQVAQLEQHALDYLDKIAPYVDKLHQFDLDTDKAAQAGRDAARVRSVGDSYDVAPVMVKNITETTWAMLTGIAISIVAAIVAKGYWDKLPDYAAMLIPAFTLLLGQIMKERGAVVAYRWDGTHATSAQTAIQGVIDDAMHKNGAQQ